METTIVCWGFNGFRLGSHLIEAIAANKFDWPPFCGQKAQVPIRQALIRRMQALAHCLVPKSWQQHRLAFRPLQNDTSFLSATSWNEDHWEYKVRG